jgi:hypothetical protein
MATGTEVISVDSLLSEDVIAFLGASGDASRKVSANADVASKKVSAMSEAMKETAKSLAIIEYQKGTAELQVQQNTRQAAFAAGVDSSTGAGTILQLMDRLNQNNQDVMKKVDEVKKLDSSTANLLSEPLQYISERFQSNSAKKSIMQDMEISKVLSGQLGIINSGIQQSAQTYRALAEPVTQSVIEERTKVVATEALMKSEELAIKGIQYNTESITALLSARKQQIDALHMLKGTKDADIRLGMAMESHALSREQFDWTKERFKLEKEAKAASRQVDDLTLEYINKSHAALGQPIMSAEEFATQVKIDKKSPEFQYHLENGRRIATTGVKGMIGANPAEALNAIKEFPNRITALQEETLSYIAQAEEVAKKTFKDSKDIRGLQDSVNKQVFQNIKSDYTTIRKGSILDVGELKPYIESSPYLSSLGITKKLFQPLMAAGQPLNDSKAILAVGVAAVKRGDISSVEFTQISDIMRVASEVNMKSRSLLETGIIVPEGGKKYQIETGGFLNRSKIDMRDPVSLSGYLVRQLVPASSPISPEEMSGN